MSTVRLAIFAAALPLLFLGAPASLPSQDTRAKSDLAGTKLIDSLMAKAWKANKLKAGKPANDLEFLRRAALDISGTIPTPDDVRLFIADRRKDKRALVIDALLKSEEYAEQWSNTWWRILGNGENPGRFRPVREAFRDWLTEQFAENVRWDDLVYDLLTVTGRTDEKPQGWYLMQNVLVNRREFQLEIAGPATGHFLGIQMACARCHDHKYIDDMKQQRFYEMAAYFQHLSTQVTNRREFRENRRATPIVDVRDRARGRELRMPAREGERRGKQVEPVFYIMNGEGLTSASVNRRRGFAEMLTKNNLQFARAVVNRYWGFMMGTGFVSPGDGFADMQATLPELLEAMARDLMKHDYDLKYLIRSIANSRVYQLSSKTGRKKQLEPSDFTVARLRPMAPHQLINALMRITGADQMTSRDRGGDMDGRRRRRRRPDSEQDRGAGFRRQAARRLAEAFDVNPDEISAYKISIQQALVLMNDQRVVSNPLRRVAQTLMRDYRKPGERLEHLYLLILSRPPTSTEMSVLSSYVKNDRRGEKVQDVAWALLNSSEFLFIH